MTDWPAAFVLGIALGVLVGIITAELVYIFRLARHRTHTAGYVVARIQELDDDNEGPQLVGFSSDVYPTSGSARDARGFAESWRPGWHIYQLTDITEEKTR